ncbi:MAG: hypothetical protein PHS60_12240 [Zavarzinia sp.]|nr:hypothetical protein [Zavarzinia sp.]
MFSIEEGWKERFRGAAFPPSSRTAGWVIDASMDPAFVEPTLDVVEGNPSTARVIVVAAPGAVGKSTLARAISATTNAVLVDLARTEPLGGNFFVGGIANAFGHHALTDIYEGRIALVVDALDEAQLRSGEEGFAAGLTDLCNIVRDGSALPAALLGRAAAAEEAWLILSDAGIDVCLLQIGFFNNEQAITYLSRRLPALAEAREVTKLAFDRHGRKFIELATATREKLNESCGSQEGRFAGYAPVLDAICAYALDEDDLNPSARLADTASEGPISLVKRIAWSILEREHGKLISQIDAPPQGLDTSILYRPEEQLGIIAAKLFGAEAPPSPQIPDAAFRQVYDRMVAEFAPQHPFLSASGKPSNAAFAAYVLVWAITSGAAPAAARQTLALQPSLGAGLYFEMYMNWLAAESGAPKLLNLDDIGSLYFSFSSQAVRGESPLLEISGETNAEFVDITFEMIKNSSQLDEEMHGYPIYGPVQSKIDGIVEFRGLIGGLNIVAPVSVILGDGQAVNITAPVQIEVDQLELAGRDMRIFKSALAATRPIGDDVLLVANDATISRVERISLYDASLSVTFPGSHAYPWAEYSVDPQPAANERIASLRRRARRILTSFRSHSKGALVRLAAKIEHARMMKEGVDGPKLLERLKADGILTSFYAGKFYELHPDKLAAAFNMDYQSIQQQQWTSEADTYLSQI